jgi:hypothetical protein
MSREIKTGRIRQIKSGILMAGCLSAVGFALSCTPAAPAAPAAPNPTVQAAATDVSGTARAVATTQGNVAQQTPAAAQTQIVSSAQGVATSVAPTLQRAQTAVTTPVAGVATQGAPTVAAARTAVAPAVAAAGTSVVATGATTQPQQATSVTVARQATATALAPTAQAVATRVAPTLQAAATQVVASVSTSVATSPVHITNVNVGATDTIVAIQNSGSTPSNLAGWTLVLGPNLSIELSDITVKAGETRQLHLSDGTDTDSDVYLGIGSVAARASLQPGAHVVLVSPPDQKIASVYSIT